MGENLSVAIKVILYTIAITSGPLSETKYTSQIGFLLHSIGSTNPLFEEKSSHGTVGLKLTSRLIASAFVEALLGL
jgi:hypothetical protein